MAMVTLLFFMPDTHETRSAEWVQKITGPGQTKKIRNNSLNSRDLRNEDPF